MGQVVYISVGNSDDKLSQAEWSSYVVEMTVRVASVGHVHGSWSSNPVGPYQNACWCVEFRNAAEIAEAREVATEIRRKWRQDSVAWAVVPETEFI